MRKHLMLLIALVVVSLTLNAQPQRATLAKMKAKDRVGNFEIQNLVSKFNRAENIGVVELRRLKQGRNHLLTDRKNGRKLMLLAERRGTKVRVVGFMIQEKNGRYFRLPNPSSSKGKPGATFGCPDNWDAKIICYTHPTYKEKVCYLRCTPTQLTLQFPPGL